MWRVVPRRAVRAAGLGLVVLAALVAVTAIAAPLLVRGPRLGRLVQGLLPAMQGTVAVGGGEIGIGAAVALLAGRAVPVSLTGVVVTDPEGVEVLRLAQVSAGVEIQRDPWRVTIHDLRPGPGAWRFARMHGRREIGFLAAFQSPHPLRPTAGRRPAADRREPSPAASGPPRFAIRSAELQALDVTFDFPGWGLVLNDVSAKGSLFAGGAAPGRPPFGFAVREIHSRSGGLLRVLAGRHLTALPFDRARLPFVGTPEASPADLLVQVDEATTGASTLSGQATFSSMFQGPRPGDRRPGMEIRAGWTRAADALMALATSRGLVDLTAGGADGRLDLLVQGRYDDLRASLQAQGLDLGYRGFTVEDAALALEAGGPPFSLAIKDVSFRAPRGGRVRGEGALDSQRQARVGLRFERLQTIGLLPPAMSPLFGGTLAGSLRASADLRAGHASLEDVDLTLDRLRRGPLPRRVRVRGGRAGQAPPRGSDQEVTFLLRGVRYQAGALHLHTLSMAAFGGRLSASGRLAVWDAERGALLPRAQLRGSLRASRIDLSRALPGVALGGKLSLSAEVRGRLDDLAVRARFPAGTAVTVLDQAYGLPRTADMRVRGDQLVLRPLRLAAPGGGHLEARGAVVLDGAVDLRLALRDHALERLPGLAAGEASLTGRLSGDLRLAGLTQRPTLDGAASLRHVTLRGVRLGDAHLRAVSRGPGAALSGDLFGRITLAGSLRLDHGGPRLSGTLDGDQVVLDPFLASGPLRGLGAVVSGRLAFDAQTGGPLSVRADLRQLRLRYGCGTQGRRPSCTIDSQGPVRLVSLGGGDWLSLERSRLRGAGNDFHLQGQIARDRIEGRLDGEIDLSSLAFLLERWPVAATGVVTADLRASGTRADPQIAGTVNVRRPVRARWLPRGPEVLVSSGALALDGREVRARSLAISLPGARLQADGALALDPAAAAIERFSLDLSGEVEAHLLERAFPKQVTRARGTARVNAHLEGTPERPRWRGQADLGPTQVTVPGFPDLRVVSGRIAVDQTTATASAITLALGPRGQVVVGPQGHLARVELLSLWPLGLGAVDVLARGRDVALRLPGLDLKDGDFSVRLTRLGANRPLLLAGEVRLQEGRISERPPPRPRPRGTSRRRAPASPVSRVPVPVRLDLKVESDGRRVVIDAGWLPDLHLDVDAHVGGTMREPEVTWRARPQGLYGAIALLLYRIFS